MERNENIVNEYLTYLNTGFPCVAAKAALDRDQIKCFVADHMACPHDDEQILQFLYKFVDVYRNSEKSFHSAAIIFKGPDFTHEHAFDALLWKRLEALALLDKKIFVHDKRVDADPASPNYSFSLKEEAFFIIGLHPASNRHARQFKFPTLVFNPHAEFEKLRNAEQYGKMQEVIRKKDTVYSGSVNPMLKNFGDASEVYQYSGVQYNSDWKCPFIK